MFIRYHLGSCQEWLRGTETPGLKWVLDNGDFRGGLVSHRDLLWCPGPRTIGVISTEPEVRFFIPRFPFGFLGRRVLLRPQYLVLSERFGSVFRFLRSPSLGVSFTFSFPHSVLTPVRPNRLTILRQASLWDLTSLRPFPGKDSISMGDGTLFSGISNDRILFLTHTSTKTLCR